ncbi:hypothetical protein ATN84_00785 [Paramesorhizobium deserti]|uniref:Protoheme IX farnesyltransferase n=2 Tax=Paramesorhizobium deserti TaxID=1494590 RepID=A0A135HYY2_9HYPH|nr:hypothetical protein ATN84_00785 [Paramesorhizobium deserti]
MDWHMSMADANKDLETISQSDKQKKAQRSRSVALGIALALFVLLVYIGTWAKLGANVLIRPM